MIDRKESRKNIERRRGRTSNKIGPFSLPRILPYVSIPNKNLLREHRLLLRRKRGGGKVKRTKLGTRLVVKRKIQSLEKLRVVGVSGGRNLEKEAFFLHEGERETPFRDSSRETLSAVSRVEKVPTSRKCCSKKKRKKWKRKRVREKLDVGRDPSSKCIT